MLRPPFHFRRQALKDDPRFGGFNIDGEDIVRDSLSKRKYGKTAEANAKDWLAIVDKANRKFDWKGHIGVLLAVIAIAVSILEGKTILTWFK